jgi:ribokinase
VIAVASGANAHARSDQISDCQLDAATVLVAQLEVPLAETATVIRRVRARGGCCVLNLAPSQPVELELLSHIDLLVANEGEAASLGPDRAQIAGLLREGLVVTRGEAGAVTYFADGRILSVPALPIAPVDTTGAGDTFVGVLAATIDRGASLEVALRRASAGAGLACLAHGAQTAMPEGPAIDRAMARLPGN